MPIKNNRPFSFFVVLLTAIGFSLTLVGCSPSHSEETHHVEDAHSATHEVETPEKVETEKHSDHETHSEVRSAESHIHGGAMLAIVSQNNRITIEFESPLYNLLGFEYAPRSKEEKALVDRVEKTLSNPKILISFNREAKCTYLDFISGVELFDDHDESHHDEDDEHHDKNHDENHDEETSDTHADVILNYELTCKAIDKLNMVRVEFFNEFSNFTELELVYLGPSKQMSANLTASKPTADLTK